VAISISQVATRASADGGQELLLLDESAIGSLAGGDVAEEDNDAVVRRADLDGEPEVKGVWIELFELNCDALVHGPVELVGALRGASGKLLPHILAEEVAFDGEQLFCAAIEKGELPSRLMLATASVVASRTRWSCRVAASRRYSAPLRSVISR